MSVELDGVDGCAIRNKVLRHFAVAGADFDPAIICFALGLCRSSRRMRRDANGARDLLAPVGIGEKMLAQALPCHAQMSVAGRSFERFMRFDTRAKLR